MPYHDSYSRDELNSLLERAKTFIYNGYNNFRECEYLYRNKSESYFSQIEMSGGLMGTELKDGGGDPRNPINNRLRGVFFSANTPRPSASPYGRRRLLVKPNELINCNCRLYFSDFFCMNGRPHHVQLVVVPYRLVSELQVLQELIELDIKSNPFLRLSHFGGSVHVTTKRDLWVEVFYADSVNISRLRNSGKASFETVGTIGRGSSTWGGIRKKRDCAVCNVPPKKPAVRVEHLWEQPQPTVRVPETSYRVQHQTAFSLRYSAPEHHSNTREPENEGLVAAIFGALGRFIGSLFR